MLKLLQGFALWGHAGRIATMASTAPHLPVSPVLCSDI